MTIAPIPREFIGLARAFQSRIAAASTSSLPGRREVRKLVISTWERRGSYRSDHLIEIEKLWRALPDFCSLGAGIERTKKDLTIADFRLSAAHLNSDDWGGDEPGLALVLHTIILGEKQSNIARTLVAAFSLHALARRYQRGFDQSDDAVRRDISALALNMRTLLLADTFTQPTADGGSWRGDCRVATDRQGKERRIMSVRTFH